MKRVGLPPTFGLDTTGKLFSKIYNVFSCSKKTQQATVEEGKVRDEPDIKTEWFVALRKGNFARLKEIIEKGSIDLNTVDENGWHALHFVAWNNYHEICQKLLEKDCDVNVRGEGDSTPLSLAVQRGHLEVTRLLVDANSDLQCTSTVDQNSGVTALHFAAQAGHTEVVRLLVARGALVNVQMTSRGIKGVTPLHLAVEAGHLDTMDILIEAGCDIQSATQGTAETAC